MTGLSTLKSSFGDSLTYFGEWDAGTMHGNGELTNDFGDSVFKGQFHRNMIHGYGDYKFENGISYGGQWVLGTMSGVGVMTFYGGARFSGTFENDRCQGKGTFTWSDGSRYIGDWVQGKQHGIGTMVDVTGAEWKGEWNNGVPITKGALMPAKTKSPEEMEAFMKKHGAGKK